MRVSVVTEKSPRMIISQYESANLMKVEQGRKIVGEAPFLIFVVWKWSFESKKLRKKGKVRILVLQKESAHHVRQVQKVLGFWDLEGPKSDPRRVQGQKERNWQSAFGIGSGSKIDGIVNKLRERRRPRDEHL